jgi:type I restriction enzyme, R subunit
VLARDSVMDILASFLHLQVEEKQVVTDKGIKRHVKETMIFPRYCQAERVGPQLSDPAFGRVRQI